MFFIAYAYLSNQSFDYKYLSIMEDILSVWTDRSPRTISSVSSEHQLNVSLVVCHEGAFLAGDMYVARIHARI